MAVKKRDLYLEIRRNVPAKERKRLGITAKTPKKRLMEIMEDEQLTGSGLFDFITAPIRKVFAPREDFNNITKKTLGDYGDAPIQKMYIMRAPITGAINTALNIVSLGSWNRVRKEANYDRLFHLSLICEVSKDNQVIPIILEKNEVVHIAKDFKKYPGYETFPLSLPTGTAQSDYSRKVRRTTPLKVLTIRQLVENALKGVGRKTFFEYDAFNNNCQFFIMYLLQYSGLLNPQAKGFIYQPMEEVVKKIPGFVPKMARMLTDLAASWNKLSGQGKTEEDCGCGDLEGGALGKEQINRLHTYLKEWVLFYTTRHLDEIKAGTRAMGSVVREMVDEFIKMVEGQRAKRTAIIHLFYVEAGYRSEVKFKIEDTDEVIGIARGYIPNIIKEFNIGGGTSEPIEDSLDNLRRDIFKNIRFTPVGTGVEMDDDDDDEDEMVGGMDGNLGPRKEGEDEADRFSRLYRSYQNKKKIEAFKEKHKGELLRPRKTKAQMREGISKFKEAHKGDVIVRRPKQEIIFDKMTPEEEEEIIKREMKDLEKYFTEETTKAKKSFEPERIKTEKKPPTKASGIMAGGQLAQRSVGTKGGLDRRQEQYRQLLVAVAIDQKFRAGEISRNEASRAKDDARSPIYQEALQRIDAVKQETGQTYEQLYRGAEARYYETPEGQMVRAQITADAEASAERRGQEIRARELGKFQKDFPVLAGIVEFGKLTAPITTEALKYVLSAIPGLPPQVRDGLNKALQLASNIATRDDVKDGQLDLFGEIGKVAGSKEEIYGGQRQNAQGIMKQLKAYALGDQDVQEKLPTDTKIILYNDLAGVEDIAELMDEKGRIVMLYPRESPTVGHWVCMFVNKDGDLEYFDPYGDEPEGTKRDLSPEKLAELGIEEDILIPLMKRSAEKRGKGVVFNSFQYQKLAPGINTCGRHCVARLAFHQATAEEYKKILDEMKKDTKKSYDDIVSILTEI